MEKTARQASAGRGVTIRLPALCLAWVFAGLCLLAGCASQGSVQIEERPEPPPKHISTHVVEKGDTLYSIAWRYELDHRELAHLNRIPAPYVINVGERLHLSGPRRAASASSPVASSPPVKSQPSAKSRATSSGTGSRSVAVQSPPESIRAPQPSLPAKVSTWNWPLEAPIVKAFGSSELTRGITLDAPEKSEVKAAADGVVVYAGSGVRGYGNFLILKHSDLYLSAYAYNSELIAKEGDAVVQGQKIAHSGKDKEGLPRLYFEIRKDGKPVDPVRYLPKR